MPENTISVTRPGKYGNPFQIGDWVKIADQRRDGGFIWMKAIPEHGASTVGYTLIKTQQEAVDAYRKLVTIHVSQKDIDTLKGHNLACWCKIGEPCHADVLLEVVNR